MESSRYFNDFWSLYPTKRDKAKAAKAFCKLSGREATLALEGVKREIAYRQQMTIACEWVPAWKYAQGWITGRCWEDELIAPEEQKAIDTFDPYAEDLTNLREMQEEGTALFANGKPIVLDGNQFHRTDLDNAPSLNAYAFLKGGNKINSGVTI